MSWHDEAWRVIDKVHASLPPDATYEQCKKALFDAYPFGERRYHPYKMWLKAQKKYLDRCCCTPPPPSPRTAVENAAFWANEIAKRDARKRP